MPLTLLAALDRLAAARGLKPARLILAEAQDKTPRRPPIAWWLK